ncbi:Long-chain-fatty-acid--CoA ligase 5 [Nymphon striatum]|nr:Long-chain-fatty-acid--CoA ligase 5 [Nymphon striatum]
MGQQKHIFTNNPKEHTRVLRNGVRVASTLPTDQVQEYLDPNIRTMYEAFCNGLKIKGDGNCLGHRMGHEYIWHSYNKIYRILCDWGSGLLKLGLFPGSFVGVYAKNCMEWVICEYGCFRHSMVIVPLYDTLGPEVCTYCICHTELSTVLCEVEEKVKLLLKNVSKTPSLRNIIHVQPVSREIAKIAKENNISLFSFEEVLKPRPEDMALIMYTSGTTGNPKGVMISHRNIIATCSSALSLMEGCVLTKDDVLISFLPLAHSFEQDMEVAAFSVGAAVGFSSGNTADLSDDFQKLKPTITPMVPRILNKIYDKSMRLIEKSVIKKILMKKALNSKQNAMERQIVRRDSIWDLLIFSKIQKGFGNRLRIIICGSAPVSAEVLNFSRCAFGCYVIEGYGQTENSGATSGTLIGDTSVGHVGAPLHCSYMKVADVPEMDYFANDNKGEICLKGPHVMIGYYRDPEKTAEAIDNDGWLHTGDIGMWLPNGAMKIIDRKKNIFKLAQGEYIAPEKIENIYVRSKYVAQVFVHGESLQSCLVGIVVPDEETVLAWAKSHGINQNFEEICKNFKLKSEILQDIVKIGKSSGLHSFEQVKAINMCSEPFSIENNMLTAVLKMKRNVTKKVFESQIQEMYSSLV